MKKKAEETNEVIADTAEAEVKKTARKTLPNMEEIFNLRFQAPGGEVMGIRKAYMGRGKLEWYQIVEE